METLATFSKSSRRVNKKDHQPTIQGLADRTPPHSIEAERSILSAMLLDTEAAGKAIECLPPDAFYSPAHQKIYTALCSLYENNIPTDLVTLTERLKSEGCLDQVGGVAAVSQLVDIMASASHVQQYVSIVLNKYLLRKLIRITSDVTHGAFKEPEDVEEFISEAEMQIFELARGKHESAFTPMKDLVGDTVKKIESIYVEKKSITGVATGFRDFDMLTSGLQPSDFIVLAARPSMGKTTFALNLVEHVAVEQGIPVGLFSLEMSKEQLVMRMLCSLARVDLSKVRTGFLGDKEFPNLVSAAGKLSSSPIFIDDTPAISLSQLRARARRLKAKEGIELVVVDYLQLMGGELRGSENRQQEISTISRGLKAIARELHVPVLVLSQLNRSVESRQDHRPLLSDLRESGAIEQDADVVTMLLRKEYYNADDEPGLADVIVAKQRNGPTRDVKLRFFEEYTRFENYSEKADSYI